MASILTALTAIVVIFVVYKFLKWLFIATKLSKIPGPPSMPFIGNLDLITLDQVGLHNAHRKWALEYGPVYQYCNFGQYVINISGPEAFEEIASKMKHLSKSFDYYLMEEWLGKGLLLNTGSQWQLRRKIMTPAFHFGILQEFVTIFNTETDRCLEVLKEEAKKPSTNILPIVSQMTLLSIAESSFGTKLDINNKSDKDYVSAIYDIGKIIVYRTFRPWFHSSILFNLFSPLSGANKKAISTLHGFTERIINEKAQDFKTFDLAAENQKERKKRAFLDLLLNAKLTKGLIDDEGIIDEVNTFMFEGHDTTSNGICYALYLLAQYPQYQDQIYEEINDVLGSATHPELQDMNEFKLMERFIKESLRYYSSVPLVGRTLDEDVVLNGYTIPKGSQVLIHLFDIHKNPKHWPDAEKFDPDRFLPENCVNRHPYAFVPFSAGPRNCIGQRFAMLEIKSMLCGIIRNFIVEPAQSTIDFEFDLVLRPANECVKLKFKPRNKV